MSALGGKVDDKIKAHADILDRFAETLESEQLALKETVAILLQEVRSPALLELEATADEVKPTLAKIEQNLKHCFAWMRCKTTSMNFSKLSLSSSKHTNRSSFVG